MSVLVLVLLISFICCVCVAAKPEHITRPTAIWQGISSPHHVTVSKSGHVFMTDSGNSRVVEFDGTTQKIINSYNPNNDFNFYKPYAMILDETNNNNNNNSNEWNLYVIYKYHDIFQENGIYRFNSKGQSQMIISGIYDGMTMGYDNNNNNNNHNQILYTIQKSTNQTNMTLITYNLQGQSLHTYIYNININEYIQQIGMTNDNYGNIYVMDNQNRRLLKINATTGQIIADISMKRYTDHCLKNIRPLHVAIIPSQQDSNIYVTYTPGDGDCNVYNIIGVYHANGTWSHDINITSIPQQHRLMRLEGITIQGNSIYVVDNANDCVIQLDITTYEMQHIYRSPYSYIKPSSISVTRASPSSPSTSVYVINDDLSWLYTSRVFVLDSVTGTDQARYETIYPNSIWVKLQGILVDSRGYMYVIQTVVFDIPYTGRILVREPITGNIVYIYNTTTNATTIYGYSIDSQNQLYIQQRGDYDNSLDVLYYNTTTNILSLLRTMTLATPNLGIRSIAIEKHTSNPSIYVSDWRNDYIRKYDMSGQEISKFAVIDADMYNIQIPPSAIAIDRNNNLYVLSLHRIIKYNNVGCEQATYELTSDLYPLGSGSGQSIYIDDSSDQLYVADNSNHRIVIFPYSDITTTCDTGNKLSNGAIAGIVVGGVVGVAVIVGCGVFFYRYARKSAAAVRL